MLWEMKERVVMVDARAIPADMGVMEDGAAEAPGVEVPGGRENEEITIVYRRMEIVNAVAGIEENERAIV